MSDGLQFVEARVAGAAWLLRAAVCGVATLAVQAQPGLAQTPTEDDADFFRREATFLERSSLVAPPPGYGFDSEYEALDDDSAEPVGATVGALPLSFDITALRDLPFDLESVGDAELLHFLEFYATEGRRRMSNWLARAGRYRALVEVELEAVGAPLELLWVAAVESTFDPTARSSAGAVGMWQFMTHTARERGLRIDSVVDDRRDPLVAARAAGELLQDLHEMFGSWPLALAAYNAGHGHVRGGIRSSGATSFWALRDYGAIYRNARRYALRVIAIAIVDRNREVFGYESVVADEPWAFDEVDAPPNVRLSLLGEAVSLSADRMLDLNPSLVGMRTPSDVESWSLRIPAGSREAFVGAFDRLRSRYGDEHELVRLRFGETIDRLAERVGVPARVIRAINAIPHGEAPPYGEEVLVPTRGRRPPAVDVGSTPVVVVPQTRFVFADRTRVFYRVNAGDTLDRVARHFSLDPYHVAAWNDLDPDATLMSSIVLQLFIDPQRDLSDTVVMHESEVLALALNSPEWDEHQAQQRSAQQRSRRVYTVRRGDTVSGIAARFGVRVSDVARWNDLGDEGMIIVGEELIVGR